MERKKILYLAARFPYPVIGGDKIKTYKLLSHLAKSHDVTLVAYNFAEKPQKSYIKEIEKLGVEVHGIGINPIIGGLNSLVRLWQKYPLEVSFFLLPEFRRVVDKLCEEKNFDLGIAFFLRPAEFIKNKSFKKILMSEDCRMLYQLRSYKQTSNLKQKIIRWWEVQKLKKYEPHIVQYYDAATYVTQEDADAMRDLYPQGNYYVIPAGVDLDRYYPAESFEERKGLIFTGRLDIWANRLMMHRIVKNILPPVVDKFPSTTLDIVGARPTSDVLALENRHVKVNANVPDIAPFLRKARVYVHPHSAATGIQNKLLEALASGCAVVSTPTGVQGLNCEHGVHVLIGKNDAEIAQYVIQILKDDKLAESLSVNARKLVEDKFSWNSVFNRMDNMLEQVLNG